MKYLLSILLVLLVGCAHAPTPALPGTLEGVKEEVTLDPRLLEECETLPDIGDNVRPSDVLEQHAKDVKIVKCWSAKFRALATTVKKAFNLKE